MSLRGGLQRDLTEAVGMGYAFGAGLRYAFAQVDYAYTQSPGLGATHRFSLGLAFNLTASRVRITEMELDNLFPAFHKRYAQHHPLGRVKLVNHDDQPHQTTVSFYIPKLMDFPTEQQVIVRPKETREIPINEVVFSGAVVELKEDLLTQAEVKVSYSTEQRTRSNKKSAGLFVYNRNAMTWDDLKKAAAFITPTDPIVAEFARSTLVAHEKEVKELGRGSRNLLHALVLFEAVKQHGVRYIADSNNPYSRMSAEKDAVDNIQYPVEVLRRKSGDCDDLTVLYCALLENVGIPTALVDAPGHIFMMFDSGVSVERTRRLPVDEDLYVVRGRQLWIPVEVTLFGASFIEAWQAGVGECARLQEESRLAFGKRVIDTAAAWEEYEPSPPRFEGEIPPPTKEDLMAGFSSGRSSLKKTMQAFVDRTYLKSLEGTPEDLELRFDLAQVYVFIRQYNEAIAAYQQLEAQGADPARLYNNRGIAYFLKGEVSKAAQSFKKAVDLDPDDEGTRANLELAVASLGKEERIAFTSEMGVSVAGEAKSAEYEVDEESFYWRE